MKEHSLFLMAGFPCKNEEYIKKADCCRKEFENLLAQVVELSDGKVGRCVLNSGEVVTEFTLAAEKSTGCLTGISIDTSITEKERKLSYEDDRQKCQRNERNCGTCQSMPPVQCQQKASMGEQERRMMCQIRDINDWALELVKGLICLKEDILKNVRSCRLFTANYPLLIEHTIREAKMYRGILMELNEKGDVCSQNLIPTEQFWNRIMMEHALFMRGLLDPSEETLIRTANSFAGDYQELLKEAREAKERCMEALTEKIKKETKKYIDFKAEGAKGIIDCEIQSLILPLLADHVLREANHYLRVLQEG